MYTKNSIIICFLCFLTYTSLFSQEQKVIDRLTTDVETKTDSLKRTWKNSKEPDSLRFKAIRSYYKMYAYAKPDSTILLTDYHYALAKEKDVTKEMFWALNQKGIVYGHKGDLDESQDFYLQALILAKQLKDPVLWALVEGDLGIIYAKQNNYQKVTQSFSTALKIFQKEENEAGESRMLNNLGSIYQIIGNNNLALEYYQKILSLLMKKDNKDRGKGLLFLNIGRIHLEQKKYKQADSSFTKALKIFQARNEPIFEAISYNVLAQVYLKQGELNRANMFAQKSLKINEKLNEKAQSLKPLLTIA